MKVFKTVIDERGEEVLAKVQKGKLVPRRFSSLEEVKRVLAELGDEHAWGYVVQRDGRMVIERTGRVRCPSCDGSKVVECPSCQGTSCAHEDTACGGGCDSCTECDSGDVHCEDCDGTGSVEAS